MGISKTKRNEPLANMIRSYQSDGHMEWHIAIAEVIDNALEECKGNAKNVLVFIDDDTDMITIADDGNGVDDINRLFQLGNTTSYDIKNTIGLYGVGVTKSAIWAGEQMFVRTLHKGKYYQHIVNWTECLKQNEWPKAHDMTPDRGRMPDWWPRGTVVQITGRRKSPALNEQGIRNKLTRMFQSAIRGGAVIYVGRPVNGMLSNDKQLKVLDPPKMLQEQMFDGEVNGKSFTGRACVLERHNDNFDGCYFHFMHRLLFRNYEPFGDMSTQRMYVEIFLGPEWKYDLSQVKDQITRDRQELYDAVHTKIKSLLADSVHYEEEIEFEDCAAALNAMAEKFGLRDIDNRGGEGQSGEGHGGDSSSGDGDKKPNRTGPGDEEGKGHERDDGTDHDKRAMGLTFVFKGDDDMDGKIVDARLQSDGNSMKLLVFFNKSTPEINAAAVNKPKNNWGLWALGMGAVGALLLSEHAKYDQCDKSPFPKIMRKLPSINDKMKAYAFTVTELMRNFQSTERRKQKRKRAYKSGI
jgi:hypothetical protein